ncbi:Hydroxymethylglutaryl-CoA reductase, class I/II [Carpediemonas membranifera]|uniref:Hydroxymethylglutaryl-CoA reductase, class I/II n=1 Tax=Carpediemonas membranifera TaxID=201153 RepID=A0A8J6B1M0_9EUKA|nr:Hydroxymethylglutaryl-CoA reductase, class I/II [Carpediemonas membranifera]|eukprot:KAG9391082.1 Hydroxymethylglutaryl-CoA reductase, class I/II [Carpediemonas membranifera]
MQILEKISENVVGAVALPLSVAPNFKIDDLEYLVPMCTEESSVVAACSNGARLVHANGGFTTTAPPDPYMTGMIQLIELDNSQRVVEHLNSQREAILSEANRGHHHCRATDAAATVLGPDSAVLTVRVSVGDSMGANAINRMMEAVGRWLDVAPGRVLCRILSNDAKGRVYTASATLSGSGEDRGRLGDLSRAFELAQALPERAVTHNKGIMNGVIAVAMASGQDTRAIEAANHLYAGSGGQYKPLSRCVVTESADTTTLTITVDVACPIGVVGGLTTFHPACRAALGLLPETTADCLGRTMACAGLASNIAALRALVGVGINAGHLRLHDKKKG